MTTLHDEILLEKREDEMKFITCLIGSPYEIFSKYFYVPVEFFDDVLIRAYWTEFLLIKDPIKAAEKVKVTSGKNYLDFMDEIFNLGNIDVYYELVLEKSRMLKLLSSITQSVNDLKSGDMDSASARITVTMNELRNDEVGDGGDTSDKMSDDLEKRIDSDLDSISTGLEELDFELGNTRRGEMTILASRTGIGKTALMLQISTFASACGYKVLYFSTEMLSDSLWMRHVCGYSRIDVRRFFLGRLDDREKELIKEKSRELRDAYENRFVVNHTARTLPKIERSIAKFEPDIVVMDHLDEMHSTNPKQSKNEALAEIATEFRYWAQQYNFVLWAVHQLNRALESRDDHEPTLQDLRWSGDLEQKADAVILLHREDVYDKNSKGITKVPMVAKIAKNRVGPRDTRLVLLYNLINQSFSCQPKPAGESGNLTIRNKPAMQPKMIPDDDND